MQVDVRVVAATNVDLQAEVRAGRFREDLFFRLNVFPIHLPPLRDRRDDIPLLMNHFLRREARATAAHVTGFTPRAVRALLHYGFPGNIRELQNLVERGVIRADDGAPIDVRHMFRREQLSEETLLAIGAHGALARRSADDGVPNLLQHLQQALGREAAAAARARSAPAARGGRGRRRQPLRRRAPARARPARSSPTGSSAAAATYNR